MDTTELYVFKIIFGLICLQFLWEIVLAIRQRRVILKNTQIPTELIGILSQKSFDKARTYALDKNNYSMIHETYVFLMSMILMFWGVMPYLWRLSDHFIRRAGLETGEVSQGAVFLVLLNGLNTISLLPFAIYHTFVLEHKHGFNKQTILFFIRDQLKQHVFQTVLLVMILSAVVCIVRVGGDYFFFYAWVFILCATLVMYTIYPDYIAPLFDKYSPLPNGNLKMEIEKVAASVGFPLYQIAIIESSRRSAHSNAFIFGVFNRRKIVLFDTLIKEIMRQEREKLKAEEDRPDTMEGKENEKETDQEKEKEKERIRAERKKGCDLMEVLAIVGHELGHWKKYHIPVKMALMQANVFLCLFLFSYFFRYHGFFEMFGFYNGPPVMIGLIITVHFVLLPYLTLFCYVMNILNRYHEFEADHFAKTLGRGQYLKCALIKLNQDNLGFPVYDPFYSSWHNSHPPLLDRLQRLDKDD